MLYVSTRGNNNPVSSAHAIKEVASFFENRIY